MKTIRSTADLAINGATPAFAEPLHVGRPNIGDRQTFQQYLDAIFDARWLTNNGPLVQELEDKLARLHKVKHCVAMSSGTVALEIAIRSLELEGEVIVPSYTFIATAHALHWQAITPVFADIDPDTHCLDPTAVAKMITPRTTGVIGVHLWGRPSHLDELQALANENNLKLMFDAAPSIGCTFKGQPIGDFGQCQVLSFHATKVFNCFEGGAVLTNDDQQAEAMKLMRNFGFAGEDNVVYPGTNGKMTEVCAAMGLTNLDSLQSVIDKNRHNYHRYADGLRDLPGIELLPYSEDEDNNYQYVVMMVGDEYPLSRDDLLQALKAENILARRYFWPGCHRMKPYRDLFPNAGLVLPHTIAVADQVIVLPTGTALSDSDVDTITSVIGTLAGK